MGERVDVGGWKGEALLGLFTSSSDDEFDKFDIIVLSTLTLSRRPRVGAGRGPACGRGAPNGRAPGDPLNKSVLAASAPVTPWPEIDFLRRYKGIKRARTQLNRARSRSHTPSRFFHPTPLHCPSRLLSLKGCCQRLNY